MTNKNKFQELLGTILDNRYELQDVVGVGGMSVVFKAEDKKENKIVAVKVLNETSDANSHAVKCFINESRAISMLSHENIVKVYDMSLGDELKYIVMELADGQTLKEYMKKKGNKLSVEEALSFVEQILLALEHAHEKGVIHRDIKPHNMIVLPDGKLKVTDFGIARAPGSDTISMSDKALGTVYYISPEQASGKETGTYSDIYSVGVMLYEMVTGKLPFDADAPVSVAMMQISNEPQSPCEIAPELPRGVEQVILKAMSKQPEDRFRSAHSMLRAVKILKESPMVVFTEKPKNDSDGGAGKGTMKKGAKARVKSRKRSSSPNAKGNEKAQVTIFPIILGMVLAFFSVLIISGIVVVLSVFNSASRSDDNVIYATVPSLVGELYDESMIEELREQHFDVEVEYAATLNDAYDYGEIYNTKPSAGEVKKIKNSTGTTSLVLYVNPVEGKATFGDYTIMTLNAAKTALRKHGYNNVEIVETAHDTVLDGYVFKTSPSMGELASTSDVITLYVSTGKQLKNVISMPNLVNKTQGQAMVELKEFEVEFVTVSNSADMGTVVGQSITPYTVIAPEFCDKIIVYVSDGQGKTGISDIELYLYMPSLVGTNVTNLEKNMKEFITMGIEVVPTPDEEEAELGIITKQSIEAGTKIPVDYQEQIIVYYGTGIKEPILPEQPETPEVIPTVRPDEPQSSDDEEVIEEEPSKEPIDYSKPIVVV